MTPAPPLLTWRISLTSRVAAFLGQVVFFVVGGQQILFAHHPVIGACVVGVPLLLCWVLVYRPLVELSADRLWVQNPLTRHVIALRSVEHVESSYGGMVVETKDGSRLVVWAVQQPSSVLFSRRRTRSDEIVDLIMRRVSDPGPDEQR